MQIYCQTLLSVNKSLALVDLARHVPEFYQTFFHVICTSEGTEFRWAEKDRWPMETGASMRKGTWQLDMSLERLSRLGNSTE